MRKDQNNSKISEYLENVIEIKRVSKKTQGGSNISFTALVVVGNKNGSVGVGYGKGRDVTTAISKAIAKAKKELVTVPIKDGTILHEVKDSFGSAKVLLKPAPKGAGIIAGGSVRTVLELSGIKDISAKMLGSNNKICNIKSTLNALQKVKSRVN